ncbi:PAAR domain-containing protein [Acinetobacter rongchengensis]|nr:PAAR domain-containing protein [Acinetobacter rongchengensis]
MMKYYICMGDRTTGGGVVVEGNVRTIIMGRPVASVGMRVMCCHGPQRIV